MALVYGIRRDGGPLLPRPSPSEYAWRAFVTEQLTGLNDEARGRDSDPLAGLVRNVAAALLETGLPLHDCAARASRRHLGGVCLSPDPVEEAVIVGSQHERMSVERVRGTEAHRVVQATMNHALAHVLTGCGFTVQDVGGPTPSWSASFRTDSRERAALRRPGVAKPARTTRKERIRQPEALFLNA